MVHLLEPNIIRILLHANLAKIKDVLHHKKKEDALHDDDYVLHLHANLVK